MPNYIYILTANVWQSGEPTGRRIIGMFESIDAAKKAKFPTSETYWITELIIVKAEVCK